MFKIIKTSTYKSMKLEIASNKFEISLLEIGTHIKDVQIRQLENKIIELSNKKSKSK